MGVRVLVTAASRHHATYEIAEAIAAGLARRGVDAEERPLEQVISLDGFDAVVIGSAVHMGRWLTTAREFVSENASELSSMPVWLFSSGPLGHPDRMAAADEPADTGPPTELTGAHGHRVFGGRLDLASLGLGERMAARVVHTLEGDCRDWTAIDAYAGEIAAALAHAGSTRF
ncbi:MAG: flavodoxin domain-containing protein [Solirubrobacteraceae bacterium]